MPVVSGAPPVQTAAHARTPPLVTGPPVGGVGTFVSWDGGCLFIGRNVLVVPTHSHYAIQVVFGSEPGVRLRGSDREEWTEYDLGIIPSRQPHGMDATRVRVNAVLFVEPETREGRALAERYLERGIADISDADVRIAIAEVMTAFDARDADRLRDASLGVVRTLTGGVEPTAVSDERIMRAIAYINGRLGSSLSLEEVAAEAYLSPSRFRHLFVEQTGMALRPYILWRRFIHVWELLSRGATLSRAAHAAGFADSAHLSRTSRRMFGFPPSAMQVQE